jgi:light-regulated signal transduction histidine kinase (bacteriophytochrome)
LIENAIKYSSTRAKPEVAISGSAADSVATYIIRDNGVGFDMKYVDKLFGLFHRLHGADEFPGTGVGLAIVRRIVARQGGRAWAYADPDAGATFSFSLPIRE